MVSPKEVDREYIFKIPKGNPPPCLVKTNAKARAKIKNQTKIDQKEARTRREVGKEGFKKKEAERTVDRNTSGRHEEGMYSRRDDRDDDPNATSELIASGRRGTGTGRSENREGASFYAVTTTSKKRETS